MAEYIEKSTVLGIIGKHWRSKMYADDAIQAALDEIGYHVPSADVVPVVRCKDCKYNLANIPDIQDGMNINENWNACQLTELYDSVEPMDFCSRGAKMDGGGQDG